jgi:hypothetical protein
VTVVRPDSDQLDSTGLIAGAPPVHPPSFGQQRLWFLDKLQPGSALYNVPAVLRVTGPLCIEVLRHLGVSRLRLMTNNPGKVGALQEAGIEVVKRISIEIPSTGDTQKYLLTKKNKLGHLLSTV